MPKKPTSREPTRRSARVAEYTAATEARMHAEALAATKDLFAQMGREMQAAEDQEAAEAFGKAVLEKEEATGLVCVMLESVEDDSDSDDSDDSDANADSDSGSERSIDDEPSEVSASDDRSDRSDDDPSDASDDEWAPDGMKERLERAMKVFVPPAAAEALETAQLTMTLAEAVPGAGADLAAKLVAGAEAGGLDAGARFAAAFAAVVAMAESDPEKTWAADRKIAQKLLTRLARVWDDILAETNAAGKKKRGGGGGGGGGGGMAALEPACAETLREYLTERLRERWGDGEVGADEPGLGLTFECGGRGGKKRARE